jgi:hypothetical protein
VADMGGGGAGLVTGRSPGGGEGRGQQESMCYQESRQWCNLSVGSASVGIGFRGVAG